mmetsp:Transcript_62523/g.69954  ORF Transcript_62523/g.69954 Transcript_62523/m.69954 type:complete len:95 (+) Transcript_62523:411-695(+)
MLNWLQAKVTEEEIQAITQIRWLNQTNKLIRAIEAFCATKDIILTRGTNSVEELFSCNKPEHSPILIVAVATKHQYEDGVCRMPCRAALSGTGS